MVCFVAKADTHVRIEGTLLGLGLVALVCLAFVSGKETKWTIAILASMVVIGAVISAWMSITFYQPKNRSGKYKSYFGNGDKAKAAYEYSAFLKSYGLSPFQIADLHKLVQMFKQGHLDWVDAQRDLGKISPPGKLVLTMFKIKILFRYFFYPPVEYFQWKTLETIRPKTVRSIFENTDVDSPNSLSIQSWSIGSGENVIVSDDVGRWSIRIYYGAVP